jgi:hypothetical protein
MVALPSAPTNHLDRGTNALREALAWLTEAREAFRRAGRADLAGPTTGALSAARLAELLSQEPTPCPPSRDPADWFLE